MIRSRLYYTAGGGLLGLILVGLGWGLANFYLVTAGAVVIAASVAWLSIPMPIIF
jgi:Flp pilus assembly protein TadB